jgi:hypothetical protein
LNNRHVSLKEDQLNLIVLKSFFSKFHYNFCYNITQETQALIIKKTAWDRLRLPKLRVTELINELLIRFYLIAVLVNNFF